MEKDFFKRAVSSLSKKWKALTGQMQEDPKEPFAPAADDPIPEPTPSVPEPEPTKFGEQLSIDLAAKPEAEEPAEALAPMAEPAGTVKEVEEVEDAKDEVREEGPDACEKVIGFNEETGNYLVVHYRRGFEARLIQANPEIKRYYSDLKNALLTYEGTKSRLSWTSDNFHNGRRQVAKINVKNGLLVLYLAIDPASLEGTVYRGRDVSDKKKYEDTPFEYKIRTPRKLKWGIELIEKTSDGMGLTKNPPNPVDYAKKYAFETTEELVNRGLIKETMTEESPADISPELLRRSGETFGGSEADAPEQPIPVEMDDEPKAEAPVAAVNEEELFSAEPDIEEISPEPAKEEPIAPEPVEEPIAPAEEIPQAEETQEPKEEEAETLPEEESNEEPEEPESAEPAEALQEPTLEEEAEPDEEPAQATEPQPIREVKPEPKQVPKAKPEEQPIFVDNENAPDFRQPNPVTMVTVDIDEVQGMYRPREVVNLLTLKSKSIVDPKAASLRIVSSSGEALPKPLKVEAERFSLSAMQAICLGGGDVVVLQWRKK